MQLAIQHVEIHASSIDEAKDFYVNRLGVELLEEIPALNLVALKAGSVRISIFGGFDRITDLSEKRTGTHLIFRTDNLDATIDELKQRGVIFAGTVFEAPGFIRGIATKDPDGNTIEIGEYLRDPLQKATQ